MYDTEGRGELLASENCPKIRCEFPSLEFLDDETAAHELMGYW